MSETDDWRAEHATRETGVNPGARLAEARELLKLSATDVARQLKLSVAQVEALERGHFDRLPGSVFVRGFIRNYARLVKLDPEDLLRAAGNSLPQQGPRPETPPSQDIPFPSTRPPWWPRYAWIAAVLAAALVFYEFFVSGEEPVITTQPIEVTPVPLPVAIPKEKQPPAPTTAPAGARKTPVLPPAAALREPADEKAAAPKPVAVTPAPEPARPPSTAALPVRAPETAPQAPKPAERQVTLVFEDESWVEIRDRHGKLILFQLNPPGTRQVVSGLPPLSFVIGNAHGVRLTYDDRPVDLERHTKTDVARMTLE
jgi:cytoskeleton protein RodZ